MIVKGLSHNRTLLDFFIEGSSISMDPLGFLSLREQQLQDVIENSKAQRIAHITPPSCSNNDWIDMNITLDRRDKRWIKSKNPGWIAGGWSEITIEWSPGPFFDASKIGFKVRLFALPMRRGKNVIKIRAKFKVIDLILYILIIMRLLKFLFF